MMGHITGYLAYYRLKELFTKALEICVGIADYCMFHASED